MNYITVDIDVNDIINDIDTKDLIDELTSRNVNLQDLGIPDDGDLKSIIIQWMKNKGMSAFFSYSQDELLEIIKKELYS